ncbi:MAG: ABC transporter substrate-binding protein [Rhizobacter sp.]|nr:ABC transporter substrate-binding protein [Rhizobacter sp.]
MINRRLFLSRSAQTAAALGVAAWMPQGQAAAGDAISAKHVTFGSSLPLTGSLGVSGKDHVMGIEAAFAAVNRTGGINGRELRLLAVDDAYVPARSAENVKQMVTDNAVLGLISQIGTPNTGAIVPIIEKAGVPLVGPITGSGALRNPQLRNVFHIRPSYGEEVTRMVQQLVNMGLQNIAFVYLDNPFGKEVLEQGKQALSAAKLTAAGEFALAFDGKNAAEVAQRVGDSRAGAVFLATTGAGVTDFVIALRSTLGSLPVVGLSVTYTDLPRLGKERAQGLAMASVFPSFKSRKFALIRDYYADMDAMKFDAPTGSAVESWINARVLIEGVRRAGRDLNRDKLRTALAGIRGFEVGELVINFSPTAPYVGTLPVKLGVMGADFTLRV